MTLTAFPRAIMTSYLRKDTFSHAHCGLIVSLFLIFVILVAYWQVGLFEFDNYDSADYVYENRYVKSGLTADSIRWALTTTHASNWHPLTWLFHMLDVQLFGLNPGPHHWVNVLIHMANSLLLFWIFRKMTGDVWPSAFLAVLFAAHPLHVESVAWVAERKDLLSTFFALMALWWYVRYVQFPSTGRFMPVLLFFILGVMAKPMIVTLPFVLLLLDYWPLERFHFAVSKSVDAIPRSSPFKVSLILEKIPLFLVSTASCVATVYAQKSGGTVGSTLAYPLYVRFGNSLVSYISYIAKMIWPSGLAVFYPHPGVLPGWQVLLSGLLIGAITCLTVVVLKSKPWFPVGWLWFLGTLVPVIGWVQVGTQAMADRYTYLPLTGLFMMIAWGLSDLLARYRLKNLVFVIFTVALAITLTVASSGQVKFWENSQTLFERALAVTQNNYVAHNNLGQYLLKQGRLTEAIGHFKKAIEINPKFELANLNLGVALSQQGKIDEAIRYYTKALQLKPDFVDAYNNLGNAFYRQAKYETAIANYMHAIRLNSKYEEAYNGIGAALIRLGNIDKAVLFFREALKINPDYADARKNLENTMTALKKIHKEAD